MAAESGAAVVVGSLVQELEGIMAMGDSLGKRKGHAPHCQQGIWAGKYVPPAYPTGSPCSKRCTDAWGAIKLGREWLERHEREGAA